MRLILGSQSPRRREILSFFSIPFDQISPEFDEESVVFNHNPAEYATEIALGKAKSLVIQYPDRWVLTADTVVYKGGKSYAKPKDLAEAKQFIRELSGGWHEVCTALVFAKNQLFTTDYAITKVLFAKLNDQQIDHYLTAIHWADKAGGYAIQLAGSLLVERLEGCYYNVMGLPIQKMAALFKAQGIDLWEWLK